MKSWRRYPQGRCQDTRCVKGEGELKIDLEFRKFDDFHPESIVKQVPRLEKLLLARQYLRDLVAKLDGNDDA